MMIIRGIIEGKAQDEGISKTTNQPYTRYVFTVNEKKYSTFDEGIYALFKVGDTVDIEGEMKGKFFNMENMKLAEGDAAIPEKVAEKGSNGQTAMYVSYAKDIFCALYTIEYDEKIIMQQAIDLVKQAKTAFE